MSDPLEPKGNGRRPIAADGAAQDDLSIPAFRIHIMDAGRIRAAAKAMNLSVIEFAHLAPYLLATAMLDNMDVASALSKKPRHVSFQTPPG